MSPSPNVFEGTAFFPKEKNEKNAETKNKELEALTDHIDYSEKKEKFNKCILDIEQRY